MNTQDLISQVEKIKQALNIISVSGYGNIKTLGNCLDAMTQLEKDIVTYEKDVQKAMQKQIQEMVESLREETKNNQEIVPVDSSKPKPKRARKEVDDIAEN
jgi:hypothetical protein